MKPTSHLRSFLLLASSTLISVSHIHAADGTWLGTTGNWTDSGIWSGGTIADAANFTANFTGVDIAADQTITLNGNRTIGNIVFTDATTSSNNLTITGNQLTLDLTSGVPSIDVTQAARQLSISSIIAGNDGLHKNGAGTLRLTAANTFTGGLTINAGTVFANPATGVNPLSSGKVTIGDVANTGAAAELLYIGTNGNNSFSNLIDVRGNGTATIRVLGYNPTFSGAVNLGNNLNVVSDNSFGSNIGISGGVTGTGNLVIQSNAANGTADSFITFSGATVNMTGTITNSGTTTSATDSHTTISAVIGTNVTGITQNSTNSNLILTGANSFTSNILVSAGTLQANLASASANPTTGALGNAQAPGRTATISSGATLRFGVSNVLGNGGSTPNLTIIANGGTILHAVNNDINSIGPVQLNGGNLSSTGTGNGGFKLTGTVTVGGSALSTISASGIIGSGSVITYDVADAVAGSGNDLNVTAVVADIFGTGGIIKTGAGTMTLTAQNTYTGITRIDNGTLALANLGNNALPNAAAVNVNGGILALSTFNETVGAVTLTSGSITSTTGVLTGSSYAVQSGTISAKLGGTAVALTKTTAGTVTISSDNSSGGYTGATNVNGGKLTVSSTGNINSTSGVSIGAGEFNYNASTALSKAVTFSGTGGTLSGSGTITPTVTISSGNTLAIGNSVGQMNFGSGLILAGTTVMEIDGTAGAGMAGGNDFANVTGGTLTYGGTMTLDLGMIFGVGTHTWNLFDFAGADLGAFSTITLADQYSGSLLDGNSDGIWDLASGSNTWQFTESSGVLALTVVPEPNVAALLGALGGILLLRRRR